MTQKPHDHLFEKSCQPGIGRFISKILKKSQNYYYTNVVQPNTSLAGLFNLISSSNMQNIYNNKTQKPHGHLFEKFGQPGIGRFISKILKKSQNYYYITVVQPNTSLVG